VAAAVLVGLLVTPRFLLTRDATHTAAAARVRVQPAKEAQMDLNAESKHAQETAAAASNAVAQVHSLTLPAAPDSPVSGAALRRAAELGDLPKLQALFDRGVDVNARDADERSALLLAVLNGRNDVVKLLLTHNANVNAADRNGTTPLQAAESTHQPAIAATLRAAGAH
jgi:ankyrin repeat protein